MGADPPSLITDVRFDHERGLYDEPFELALSIAASDASIRYTFDGSVPTTTAGTLYAGPIRIDNTTVVHAIGYRGDSTATGVFAETYIFPMKVLQQPENLTGYPNPKEPINTPGPNEVDVPLTYGMDPKIVDDPQYAQQALQGLSQIPTLSIGVDPNNIFGSNGLVHGTFVHLYLNGIYWGLYNLAERPDDGYGEAYFHAKKHDYFSISQNGVASGDDTRWNYLINMLSPQDMSVSPNYAQMQKYLNMTQFADYLIGQWFCGVSDWPSSNYWAGGDTSKGQPFQFYAWDGEFMINTVDKLPTIPHGPWCIRTSAASQSNRAVRS